MCPQQNGDAIAVALRFQAHTDATNNCPDLTSRRPVEDPDCWPTWANVVNRLKRVLDNAKPGDPVYLHYAGHGTRLPQSAKSAHSAGNLALVLFDETGPSMRYFHGQLLASCLRRMVQRDSEALRAVPKGGFGESLSRSLLAASTIKTDNPDDPSTREQAVLEEDMLPCAPFQSYY